MDKETRLKCILRSQFIINYIYDIQYVSRIMQVIRALYGLFVFKWHSITIIHIISNHMCI